MKKIKSILLVAVCMSLFSFSSCDDDYKADAHLKDALKSLYPTATRIEWEKKKSYRVADCRVDNKDLDVWFTKNAEWKMTEVELKTADIPTEVAAALADTKYASWRIDDVDLLQYPGKPDEYVIEVEQGHKEIDLYFSADGTYLREKDVTTADDTHWPE